MFALVDCNNFYVSCERVFAPRLAGKPVIVLSNNDGCIIARSEEAKKIGLKMAEPVFKLGKLLKSEGVEIFSSNYALYGDMSQRVTDILADLAPEIEPYSIDEAFLNISGITLDYDSWAKKVAATILQSTGIPVSIGIGQTKTLAKIASKAAKHSGGIFIIKGDNHRDSVIRNTPVNKIWGIGRQYSVLLRKNSVETAYDMTLLDDNWLKSHMKVIGLRIKKELLGESCIPLEMILPAKKAIATTRAFGKKVRKISVLKEAVSTYAVRCAEKLRKQHSVAGLITVFIHTDPFNPGEAQINKTRTIALPVMTSSNSEIVKHALICLENIFEPGYLYKKAGVIVDGLQHENTVQGNLFTFSDSIRQKRLNRSVDKLNRKFGRDKVKLAVQGDGKKWKLRQEKLSKRYTTRWKDIIEVKG